MLLCAVGLEVTKGNTHISDLTQQKFVIRKSRSSYCPSLALHPRLDLPLWLFHSGFSTTNFVWVIDFSDTSFHSHQSQYRSVIAVILSAMQHKSSLAIKQISSSFCFFVLLRYTDLSSAVFYL